jgi:hypothetical protein
MKRITSTIDENLQKAIKEMAEKRNWSFDYMVYVLLQQAVKEKIRKKSAAKENHS